MKVVNTMVLVRTGKFIWRLTNLIFALDMTQYNLINWFLHKRWCFFQVFLNSINVEVNTSSSQKHQEI